MTLAQVQAITAFVVAMMGTWAGVMIAIAILLPAQAGKAEVALEQSAKRCFGFGLIMLFLLIVAFGLLNSPLPQAKFLGFLGLLGIGGILTVGAAGMASLMGKRIGEMSGAKTTFSALAQGSFAYSASVFFPLIGWFVIGPISAICALGAGILAVWPERRRAILPPYNPNAIEGRSV